MTQPFGQQATVVSKKVPESGAGATVNDSYRQLFESLPIGIYRADPAGRIVFANLFLARLLAYASPEELLLHGFHLGSLHSDPVGFKKMLEIRGEIHGLETAYLRQDGRQIWIRENVRAIFEPSRGVVHLEGTIEDITERKLAELALRASEERYRVLSEISANYTYVYRVTLDGKFEAEWIGGDYHSITGYTPEEVDALGGWNVLHHPDDLDLGQQRDLLIRKGEPSVTEFRIRRRDGQWRWLHNVVKPVRDERTGAVVRFFGATVDITESKRIEEELRASKEAAEAANRAKSDFLANVSHEIRTPLHGIMGTLELLRTTELDSLQSEYADLATKSADVLLAMINDLLDFAKVEAGKLELEAIPFSLRELIRDSVRLLAVRAGAKGLKLSQRVADGVPDSLVGDPTRLRQVLVNLVDNAIKFTPQGEVAVSVQKPEVSGDAFLAPGSCVFEFSVRDTGIGIPTDKQARIFQAFAQADPSMTRQYGGTGLGLSIATRLVQMMGGWLSVDSEPGKGSTFRFTVPFPVAPPPSARTELPQEKASAVRALRVLVAEDNAINQRLIRDILETEGHTVTVVGSGREVLAELERQSFDVILMDVYMPHLDGFQTTVRIREREKATGGQIPIVALTAHALVGYKDACLKAGMTDYVSKPFRIQDIKDALARVTPW